jgi:hypothetical protein
MYVLREKLKLVVVLLIHVFKSSACSNNMMYTKKQNAYIVKLLKHHDVTEKLRKNERITRALWPVYDDFRTKYKKYEGSFEAFKNHWEYLVSKGTAAPVKESQPTVFEYTDETDCFLLALKDARYKYPGSLSWNEKQRWEIIHKAFLRQYEDYQGTPKALQSKCKRVAEKQKQTPAPAKLPEEVAAGDTPPQKEPEGDTLPLDLDTGSEIELETDGDSVLPESQVVFNVPMGALAGVKDPMDVLVPETWPADEDVFNTKECPENVINEQNEWLDNDDMEEMNRWLGEDVIKQPEVREDVPEDEPPKKRAKVTIHHDSNVSPFPEGPMQHFLIF